jgi:CheY-like chemotaxis protein
MQGLNGRRVLVVDDEVFIRLMVADEFEHRGCSVEQAADGVEALEALSGRR